MTTDYTPVTEVPGIGATGAQLARLYQRYYVASRYCQGKRVLEVGCGAGLGLGYLAREASDVLGGDYTGHLLQVAQRHYRGSPGLLQLDAHALPFLDASFDTVIFLEGIYYLRDFEQFLEECRRVLREEGTLVLGTVNREWADFNPSPHSTAYYSASELSRLLASHGFQAELFGAFPAATDSLLRKAVSLIRRTAVSLHLIPGSMKGKELLKRLFYGKLTPLPPNLGAGRTEGLPGDMAGPGAPDALIPLSRETIATPYTILYAIGHLR